MPQVQTGEKDVQQTREGVVSEDSVGAARAAQVCSVSADGASPDPGHAAVLRGREAMWVQTGVVIMQRGAFSFC